MKVLLVRAKPHKESIGLQSFMICEPLELEYISSYIDSKTVETEIIDMILEKKPLSYFIKKHNPDVVAFTAYITHVGIIKEYAKIVKEIKKECITIAGGVHAQVIPEDFEDENIDYVVKVNEPRTIKNIIEKIAQGEKPLPQDVAGVWQKGKISYANIIKEIEIPFPNREKTAKYRKYYNYVFHKKCAIMKTSYGCPYNCDFCFCIQAAEHKYNTRELNSVINEIKTIKEDNIFIVDDNFLFNRDRVLEFCRLIKENGIKKNFILFGRADFISENEDVIEVCAGIGLKSVFVGIESFKEEELENYNKKVNVEMNIRAIRILEKYGVECYSGIIVGIDWEDKDFANLAKWLNKFKQPMVNIQPITPMPGTPLYERMKSEIFMPRTRFEMWDMAHLVIKPHNMSVSRFYYNILKTYYKTSVNYKGHLYIIKKYGLKTYFTSLWGSIYITFQYIKMIIRG